MKRLFLLLMVILIGCFNVYAEENDYSIEGNLSSLTMIRGDTAYIKIYSTLTSVDDSSLQNDLWIIDTMPEVKNIRVYLNSSGGVAYAGFSLADLFIRAQKKYDVEVYASGVVASAAVIVFASIEKRYAGQSTSFLVHELRFQPSSTEKYSFTPSELERMDRLFGMLTNTYLDILMKEGSGLSREEWAKMMKDETWFTASDAVEWGLVKEIR